MTDRPIAEELARFVDGVEAATGYRPTLAPGAAEGSILDVEARLGVVFGPQMRELYLASDGGVVNSVAGYCPLAHVEESTRFQRSEISAGELSVDIEVREVMDPNLLLSVAGVGPGEWLTDPEDPKERIYTFEAMVESFGLIGNGWRSLMAMFADLAEDGFLEAPGTFVTWRITEGGQEAIHALEHRGRLTSKYEIGQMP